VSTPQLFDPARHEPLTIAPWHEATARDAVARIAAAAVANFDPSTGWRCHPLDDPKHPDERFHMLYCGSGGVIWALEHLARCGAIERAIDFAPFVEGLVDRNRVTTEAWGHGTASYLMGDAGLLLLQWTMTHEEEVEQRMHEVVRGNLRHPANEALWGSPGTVLAAIHMAEATGRVQWGDLVREALAVILEEMQPEATLGGAFVCVQDMYGRTTRYLGAGHGFAGNVYPALRAGALLDAPLREIYITRALQTLQVTALQADGLVNWHTHVPTATLPINKLPLVQDCHGAPGIVCRLAPMPRTPAWDALLRGAGELTWRAGPLVKGASLCHGTTGSGMACLKLWRRTGDDLWLRRARALAMHAIEQVERHRQEYGFGRHSLWTGDLGVACFIWNCIVGDDAFPTLDVF
jgi:Lanthionine synthetase C-like protein